MNGTVLVNAKQGKRIGKGRARKVPRENSSLKGDEYERKYLNPFYGFFACWRWNWNICAIVSQRVLFQIVHHVLYLPWLFLLTGTRAPAVSCNSIASCILTSLRKSEWPFLLKKLQKLQLGWVWFGERSHILCTSLILLPTIWYSELQSSACCNYFFIVAFI